MNQYNCYICDNFAKYVLVTLVTLVTSGLLNSQVIAQTYPSENDYLRASSVMGLAVGLEMFGKDQIMPKSPRITKPGIIDSGVRLNLLWDDRKQENAQMWSDRLIYGVFASSLLWGPLLAEQSGLSALINMEVFATTSVITNMIKVLAARERPYHHFGTAAPRGPDDFASFISGHSSIAFSQAISNSMILSDSYPKYSKAIWATLLTSAGTTAYLRVAGDMHYFTDILMGACIGSLIAWKITDYEMNKFNSGNQAPTNFTVSLKIPLG